MGGYSDWAIDLETCIDEDGGGDGDGNDDHGRISHLENLGCTSNKNPGDLEGIAEKVDELSERCLSLFTLDTLYNQLLNSLSLVPKNSGGYDDKFGYYADWVKDTISSRLAVL